MKEVILDRGRPMEEIAGYFVLKSHASKATASNSTLFGACTRREIFPIFLFLSLNYHIYEQFNNIKRSNFAVLAAQQSNLILSLTPLISDNLFRELMEVN
jgi:hypothetical protein